MDTNVLVAGLRSRRGASYEVLSRLRAGHWTVMLSNHLVYEYEEVLKRQGSALSMTAAEVDAILTAVCARAEEWPLPHGWEPVLADPDDEPLVQLAHESGAKLIISHNVRDLQPARRLGIEILKPKEFLERLGWKT